MKPYSFIRNFSSRVDSLKCLLTSTACVVHCWLLESQTIHEFGTRHPLGFVLCKVAVHLSSFWFGWRKRCHPLSRWTMCTGSMVWATDQYGQIKSLLIYAVGGTFLRRMHFNDDSFPPKFVQHLMASSKVFLETGFALNSKVLHHFSYLRRFWVSQSLIPQKLYSKDLQLCRGVLEKPKAAKQRAKQMTRPSA